MTKIEALDKLRSLGLKKTYKPYFDPECESILLKTRKPSKIVDGLLKGTEIDLYDGRTFRIWTNRVNKALSLARRYKLKITKLTGECELFVPISLADDILPGFGAKVKKQLSPETKAKLRETAFKPKKKSEHPSNVPVFGLKHAQEGTSSA